MLRYVISGKGIVIRALLFTLIILHGLIHLTGFVREWGIAPVEQLSGKTLIPLSENIAKTIGIFWLAASVLLFVSAAGYIFKKDWWWMVALVAIFISQLLIILYWKDAKFGTVANAVILVVCIASYGSWTFERMVNTELSYFKAEKITKGKIVTSEKISDFPEIVGKWLDRSGVIGREIIYNVFEDEDKDFLRYWRSRRA